MVNSYSQSVYEICTSLWLVTASLNSSPKFLKDFSTNPQMLQNFSTDVDNPSRTLIVCPLNRGNYTQDFYFCKKLTGLFTPCGKHLSKVGIIFIHILTFLWKTVFFRDIMNGLNEFKDSSY